LTDGNTVTLADGSIVTPDMVSDKSIPAQGFVIVFLPNESYVESFLAENGTLFNQL